MVREPKIFRKTPEYANPQTWYRSRQNILKPSNPARAHLKPSQILKQGFPDTNWYTNRAWQAAALKNLEKSKICYRKKFGARKPQKHGTTIQPCTTHSNRSRSQGIMLSGLHLGQKPRRCKLAHEKAEK